MKTDSVLLTVDWDYFIREEPEWDLGHRENPFFSEFIWVARAASFAAVGKDLRRETDPKRWGTPPPDGFWKALLDLGFDFSGVEKFVVSDSHLAAGIYFLTNAPPADRIVSFDAHHDCGYGRVSPGMMDCANWMRRVLEYNPKLKGTVVYPIWKGLSEWHPNKTHLPKIIRRKVNAGIWGHEPFTSELPGKVRSLVVCRSSAWTPPFFDKSFIAFAKDAEKLCKQSATIMTDFGNGKKEPNPVEPRKFDDEEFERVYAMGAETAAAMEAIREAQ